MRISVTTERAVPYEGWSVARQFYARLNHMQWRNCTAYASQFSPPKKSFGRRNLRLDERSNNPPTIHTEIMGKKRKASSQAYNNADRTAAKPESSKLLINSYQDVADSDDEFLDNRDRILLDEGRDAKKRRKVQEEGTYS